VIEAVATEWMMMMPLQTEHSRQDSTRQYVC